jgi:hypothetical protein
MKINELMGYKKNPDYQDLLKNPNFQEFAKKAESQGWKVYGQGGYGAVVRQPGKNFLYKIFTADQNYTQGGYLSYVNWARENSKNPFVPNVGKPFVIKGTETKRGPEHDNLPDWKVKLPALYAVKIEELDPAKGKNDPRFKKFIDPKYKSKLTGDDDEEDRDGDSLDNLYWHAIESLYQFNKDARAIIEFAYDMYDNHVGNVMFRGDQLVFTDPVIG